jgi:hypothetical protein
MELPILGTIDLTPTGIFLFFAAVLAIGYFGWQIFGTARAGRDAGADTAPQVESGKDQADADTEPREDKPTDT